MPCPRRVLYLTTSGQVGGAERCLASLIAGLEQESAAGARWQPRVLVGSPGPLFELLAQKQVDARLVALPPGLRRLSRYHGTRGLPARAAPAWQAPAYYARLRQAGGAFAPHLVHSNGVKMHYLSALMKTAWGAPLIWHLHDFPDGRVPGADGGKRFSDRVLRHLARRVDRAIVISEAVAAAYRESMPELTPRLRVIPNGVNAAALQGGDGRRFRQALGLRPEDFVVGMIAIFAPWKGQEIFLQAAAKLHARSPGARFLLVGDDIYDTAGHGGRRRELEVQARTLGLGDAVIFSGFINDLAPAYAALNVMVHASTRPEPFGRTAIEAMAAGVPVVGAAAGGMVEVLEDGVSGLLTPPGEVEALAAALLRLQDDPGLRRRLADAGLRRVESRFSEAEVGRRVADVYREVLERVTP